MSHNVRTANLAWQGEGMGFTATGGSGYSVQIGSSPTRKGVGPMELVAIAAGGCTALDVIDILLKKRQNVTGFEVNVKGVRANDHPKVYTEIELEYVVRGADIDPKAVERSIELSLSKYCSVNKMLEKAVKITSRYRIEEETASAVAS